MNLDLQVSINIEELAITIGQQCDYNQALKIIKLIDAEMADLDFTREVRDWFVEEVKKEEQEEEV